MKLGRSFYLRDTTTVAKELLGKRLIHRLNTTTTLEGIIVETEAYLGVSDPACHSYLGHRSKRNESMFLPGGFSYVYLIYGLYHCLNIVTCESNDPQAVLIRAVEPINGIDRMQTLRMRSRSSRQGPLKSVTEIANGPGKLCLAFGIDKAHDGLDLQGSKIYLTEYDNSRVNIPSCSKLALSPRIGVSGPAKDLPLRFYFSDSPFISRKPSTRPTSLDSDLGGKSNGR